MRFAFSPLFIVLPIVLSGCVATTANSAEKLVCASPGQWQTLPSGAVTDAASAVDKMSKAQVVLLGETHNRADHHQWQLHTLAGLYGRNASIAVGFEMFPRKSQAALDDWVAGKSTAKEFLEASRWNQVWRFDAGLYKPLLDFVRLNRLPSKALNVERTLNSAVSEKGWEQVPVEEREGISDPAAPSAGYQEWLFDIYKNHQQFSPGQDGENPVRTTKEDPGFKRFVQSQVLWDRAMAEALSTALKETDITQVVGIIGSGHVVGGHGVAHQLRDLGITQIAMALPVDGDKDCGGLAPNDADLLFVTTKTIEEASWRPLLGVMLEQIKGGGVKVHKVMPKSVAEKTGLKKDDQLLEIAGTKVKKVKEAVAIVRRQAPGTWLPLRISREGKESQLVAKFPTAQ